MTKNETAKLLAVLEAYYMSADMDPEIMVNAWHKIFARDKYEIVEQAAINFAASDSRQYPKFPVPGQIKKQMELLLSDGNTPEELWNKVYKAICGSGHGAAEEFKKLPKCCQRWLGDPNQLRELGMAEISKVNTVTRGQFLNTIEHIRNEEVAKESLPDAVKQAIDGLLLGMPEESRDKLKGVF